MGSGPTEFSAATLRSLLDPLNASSIKTYYEYDSDGDQTAEYRAQAVAEAGANCLKKTFEYITVSGIKMLRKESWSTDTWSGSVWDI